MFEISGKIKLIEETQSFSSGFTKREFVVTTGDSKYPQDIKFEIVKDKCSLLDSFSPGQDVLVNFDVRGNEYNGRYYVNLNCWKIQAGGGGDQDGGNQGGQQAAPQNEPKFDNPFGNQQEPSSADLRSNFDDGDDIPF